MIGIGIIGAGHFGAVHARALASIDEARLVAACGPNADTLAAFTARHGGTATTDWRDLLAIPDIDIVVIATPHHLHHEVAIAALEAGKHVLLEKPMAHDVASCRAIDAAARRGEGMLMIGHVMHFFRPIVLARQIIESGEIGSPIAGHAIYSKFWMESNRRDWHLRTETGGGMLMTAGIHALDRLVFLMGGRVAAVGAMAGALFHSQDADDTAMLNLRFDDGRLAQVTSIAHDGAGVRSTVDIVATRGTLCVDFDRGVRVASGPRWRDVPDALDPDDMLGAIRREWIAFLAAIQDGGPVPVSGAYGTHMVEIIAAARASARLGREVGLAPSA